MEFSSGYDNPELARLENGLRQEAPRLARQLEEMRTMPLSRALTCLSLLVLGLLGAQTCMVVGMVFRSPWTTLIAALGTAGLLIGVINVGTHVFLRVPPWRGASGPNPG